MAKDYSKMAGANIVKQVASNQKITRTIDIPVEKLKPSPHNGEIWEMNEDEIRALADGIKRRGFEGSIGAYDMKDGTYEIYDGHMRVEAARLAGLKTVPAHVKDEPSEKEKWDDLLSSNMDGRTQDALSRARAIAAYKEHVMPNATLKDLAEHFAISLPSTARLMGLMDLNKDLQPLARKVNYTALSNLKDLNDTDQSLIAGRIRVMLEKDMPVTESVIDKLGREARMKEVKEVKEVKVKEHKRKVMNRRWLEMEEGDDEEIYEAPSAVELLCAEVSSKIKRHGIDKQKSLTEKEKSAIENLIGELSRILTGK